EMSRAKCTCRCGGCSCFLATRHDPADHQVDQRKNDGTKKGGKKSDDGEAGNEHGSQLENDGVDDEPENAERNDGKRKGNDLQEEADRGVEESDYQGCDKR